jgi:hypothetical protein
VPRCVARGEVDEVFVVGTLGGMYDDARIVGRPWR